MSNEAERWLLPQPDMSVPTAGFKDADGSVNFGILMEYISGTAEDANPTLPAFDEEGNPVLPPDAHIRDHLARSWDLVPEEDEAVAIVRARTVHVELGVWSTPCDLQPCESVARYDAKIMLASRDIAQETNAWLCTDHARQYVSRLGGSGAGSGYYVMLGREVPEHIREAVDVRCNELGRDPLFEPVV